jgi:glucose-6-phosphate dehydrogenase assembly protein OpcA
VTVRHHAGSAVAGLLLVGWLASRLEWQLRPLRRRGRVLAGSATRHRHDVRIALEPSPRQRVHGLAGLTLESASGRSLSLERATGGLLAHHRDSGGEDRVWTLLGASRGEAGILGEGIRQAMLDDTLYGPALAAASTLAAEA